MKKYLLMMLVSAFLLLSGTAYSLTNFWQTGVSYDNTGQIVDNTNIDVRVTISNSGNPNLYQQTFTGVATGQFAVFQVEVDGSADATAFAAINADASTRIKVETSTDGGTTWVMSAMSSLTQVQYNTIVIPGNIEVTEHHMIMGDVNDNGEDVAVGGDLTAQNNGTGTAVFTIADDAVTSAKIDDETIVNADVSGTAAIAVSKLAGGSNMDILYSNGTTPTWGSVADIIQDLTFGDGLATWHQTYDGTTARTVSVKLADATLLNPTDGSGISLNLGNANTWTATQTFPTTTAQGDAIIASANAGTAEGLYGDIVNIDNTLQVTSHDLGIDLDHANTWTAAQGFTGGISSDLYSTGTSFNLGSGTADWNNIYMTTAIYFSDHSGDGKIDYDGSTTTFNVNHDMNVAGNILPNGNRDLGGSGANTWTNIYGVMGHFAHISVSGTSILGDQVGDNVRLNGTVSSALGDVTVADNIVPTNNTYSLGSATTGWANVYATTFHGALDGNASTATTLQTAHDFSVSGDVATSAAVSFNGSGNVDLSVSFASGVIVDEDINAGAEIAVSKLADGDAGQIIVTGASGTTVGWADVSNVMADLTDGNGIVGFSYDGSGAATVAVDHDGTLVSTAGVANDQLGLNLGNANTWTAAQGFTGGISSNVTPNVTDGSLDLGDDTHRWGSLYITGSAIHMGPSGSVGGGTDEGVITYSLVASPHSFVFDDAVTVTSAIYCDGLDVNGGVSIHGNMVFGDAATDGIDFRGIISNSLTGATGVVFNDNIIPNGNHNLGASGTAWANVYATTFHGAFDGTAAYADDLNGGAAGSLPYQDGANSTVFLAAGTGGQFLTYDGTNHRPQWSTLTETDPVWVNAEPNYANLGQAETITANWVNTANPWADNEVANNLTINGGTIDNTPIGGTTPSTGAFTTLSASSTLSVTGATTLSGNATVGGNTTLGDDATADVTTMNSTLVTKYNSVSGVTSAQTIPNGTMVYDLGISNSSTGGYTITLPSGTNGQILYIHLNYDGSGNITINGTAYSADTNITLVYSGSSWLTF
jgi:hypothetical protein